MTQEEKQLLLKDLCVRLPYGLKCYCKIYDEDSDGFPLDTKHDGIGVLCTIYTDEGDSYYVEFIEGIARYNIEEVKPYLRPMSSMTEEEKEDILQALNIHGDIDTEGNLLLGVECNILTLKVCKKYIGELNKRMFDVCHLIEKGLALEAPEGMYNIYKKK